MEIPLLSPEGVTQKTNELYQLPESELNGQAALIDSDIRNWLKVNFEMTEDQKAFMSNLDPDYIAALAEQTSRAVRHRWPIIFRAESAAGQVLSAKWVRSREEDEVDNRSTRSNVQHVGKLIIETGY